MNYKSPYDLTIEIDRHFRCQDGVWLNTADFYDVVYAISYAPIKKQNNLAELFKSLPRKEVIERSKKIKALSNLLKKIYDV